MERKKLKGTFNNEIDAACFLFTEVQILLYQTEEWENKPLMM